LRATISSAATTISNKQTSSISATTVTFRKAEGKRKKEEAARVRQARGEISLSSIQFFPLSDIEMAHPSALIADRMTCLGVFPGERPTEVATTSASTFGRAHSRIDPVPGESEYFPRKER
jgi:hypothetical protein